MKKQYRIKHTQEQSKMYEKTLSIIPYSYHFFTYEKTHNTDHIHTDHIHQSHESCLNHEISVSHKTMKQGSNTHKILKHEPDLNNDQTHTKF